MLQLLVKDIRIQKQYIALGFVFVGVVFFALGAFEGLPLAVPAAIFSHFLIVVSSKWDEKNNNGRMLASFPLKRRDIVGSKYAGVFMFTAIAFLLTLLWRVLAALALPEAELPWFSPGSMLIAVAVLFVFYSIYFPLFFAFGSRISQALDLIVIFAIGGAAVVVIRVLEWMDIHVTASMRHAVAEESANDAMLGWWAGGACLLLFILSWLIAVYLYERRNI